MAGFYRTFTANRVREPELRAVEQQVRALDPTAGVAHVPGTLDYTVKKNTDWLPAQITAVQTAFDTASVPSVQLVAQLRVDDFPLETQALVLTLLDQINVLRAALALPAITPAQALAAVRAKAGTL